MLRTPRGIPFLALLSWILILALLLLLPLLLFPRDGAVAVAPVPGAEPSPTAAEREALAVLLEDGRQLVRQLAAGLQGLPEGPARRDLGRRIREAKAETRLRFLETKLEFARERGDVERARTIEAVVDRLRNPPRPAASSPPASSAKTRERTPTTEEPAAAKGGAR